MSLKQDILSSGSSAVMAQAIVGSIQNGISAAGTNQSTATKLGCAVNFVSTVASGTGVMLPVMFDGDECVIVNEGANTLSIYPIVGSSIGSLSANVAVSLFAGASALFKGTAQRNYKRIGSSADMPGTAYIGTLAVSGNATIGGTLGVTGQITASGGVSLPGKILRFDGSMAQPAASDVWSIFANATSSTADFISGGWRWVPYNAGTYASPVLTLTTGGNLTATGEVLSSGATNGIGYTTGAGGTATQLTSKATGVTLNKVCGTITMNAAALAANTSVSFALTNSAIAATDYLFVQHDSAGTLGAYSVVAGSAAGSATITVRNLTAGSLSEAIVLRFAVFKAVVA